MRSSRSDGADDEDASEDLRSPEALSEIAVPCRRGRSRPERAPSRIGQERDVSAIRIMSRESSLHT